MNALKIDDSILQYKQVFSHSKTWSSIEIPSFAFRASFEQARRKGKVKGKVYCEFIFRRARVLVFT